MLVSISDILDVVKDYRRPLVEGEAVLNADMLVLVGRLISRDDLDEDSHKVKALCLQTSAVFSHPHQIEVELNLDDIYNRIISLSCTCTAGDSEKCKHIVAVLMYLNKTRNWTDLEELSSTDLEQQWGKMKAGVKADFDAIPVKDFCHISKENVPIYSRSVPEVSEELASNFAEMLIAVDDTSEAYAHSKLLRSSASAKNCGPESAGNEEKERKEGASAVLAKILERESSSCISKLKDLTVSKLSCLPSDLLQFYDEKLKIDEKESVLICVGSISQVEKLWYTERACRITGSKCYCLYTYCFQKNPDWDKKLKSIYQSTFSGNAATAYGLQNEPLARDLYVLEKRAEVIETGLIVYPTLPWLGYSPDGIIVDTNGNPDTLLEIKCLEEGKKCCASELSKVVSCFDRKTNNLKKKHPYNGQIQLGMLLLGLKKCDFVLYSSFDDKVAVHPVDFDEDFAYVMLSNLTYVYFDKVLPWLKRNKSC